MLDKMSDTSRIVDRLIIKDLVKKNTCKADKRLVDVTITSKGKELLTKLDQHEISIENIMQSLTEKEAQILNTLLDKVRNSQ
jgi:DNA-binding MarR family transcriptional regulator